LLGFFNHYLNTNWIFVGALGKGLNDWFVSHWCPRFGYSVVFICFSFLANLVTDGGYLSLLDLAMFALERFAIATLGGCF